MGEGDPVEAAVRHVEGAWISDHHVPSEPIGQGGPESFDRLDSDRDIFLTARSGGTKGERFLNPLKGDFTARRWSRDRRGTKKGELVMKLEAKDESEFVLILSVSAERPVVRHVE